MAVHFLSDLSSFTLLLVLGIYGLLLLSHKFRLVACRSVSQQMSGSLRVGNTHLFDSEFFVGLDFDLAGLLQCLLLDECYLNVNVRYAT
jgi:hypothetical protein